MATFRYSFAVIPFSPLTYSRISPTFRQHSPHAVQLNLIFAGVYVIAGISTAERCTKCWECGKPLKASRTLHAYKRGLCDDHRPNLHKARRMDKAKLVCPTCKKMFERKICQLTDRRRRGMKESYCSKECADSARRTGVKNIRYFKGWGATTRYCNNIMGSGIVLLGMSRTGRTHTVELIAT